MFKQFQIRKKSRSKSPSEMIRSQAFMKKCEDDIPRINNKAIPIYHTYGLTHSEQQELRIQLKEFEAWAMINTEYIIPRGSKRSKTERKKSPFTSSENLLAKYLRRRPSLLITQKDFLTEEKIQEKYYKTQQKFLCIPKSGRKTACQTRNSPAKSRQKDQLIKLYDKTNTTIGTSSIGQDELFQFNNKLALNMIETDTGNLNQSNQRFMSILERKKRRSQCGQYKRKFQHY